MKRLNAVVLGSGFAAKGHTEALRSNGVEVAAMVSRTETVVREVAAGLGVPDAGTDWRGALVRHRPDIVAIGTPGGAHVDPILAALAEGCHVFCDKPLAPSAAEAERLYRAAAGAGVKTAYAASYYCQAAVLHARRFVRAGGIGEPLESECVSHYDLNPLIPFGWSHSLGMGGGRLNNNFTHKLAIVQTVVDGEPIEAAGECRNDLGRAPVGGSVHDFREREDFAPASAESHRGDWATVDSDWSYTVGVRLRCPSGSIVSAWFRHGGLQPRFGDDYVAFYGREGALYIPGAYAQGAVHHKRRGQPWQELATPPDITAALPAIANDTQRNWTAMMGEFVRDIRGESFEPYPTFRDGWVFQQVIDSVRRSAGWQRLASD